MCGEDEVEYEKIEVEEEVETAKYKAR